MATPANPPPALSSRGLPATTTSPTNPGATATDEGWHGKVEVDSGSPAVATATATAEASRGSPTALAAAWPTASCSEGSVGTCLERSVDLRPPSKRAKEEGRANAPTTTGLECKSAISATGPGAEATAPAGSGQRSCGDESKDSAAFGTMKPSGCAASSNPAGSVVSRGGGTSDGAGVLESPRSLSAWLKEGPFVLSMSPGFFGFYAHIGALIALDNEGLLNEVSFATGASAGGLVAGLFAAGLSPTDMGDTVVKFRRSDFWDPVGFGGLLRGKKFEDIVKGTLPGGVRRFDQGRIPLAVSAFDVSRLTTRTLDEGCIAQALRATCTFPGLFSPVWHDRGVLVDGGVRDTTGMWCVPEERQDCRRILNVTFGSRNGRGVCVPPSSFPTASNPRPAPDGMEIVSLPLTGLPRPHPFAMERGVDAMEAARNQVAAAIGEPLLKGHGRSHWIAATTATQPPPAKRARRDGSGILRESCVAASNDAVCSSGGSSANGERGEAAGGVKVKQEGGICGRSSGNNTPSNGSCSSSTELATGTCRRACPAIRADKGTAAPMGVDGSAVGSSCPRGASADTRDTGLVDGRADRKRKAEGPLVPQAAWKQRDSKRNLPSHDIACLGEYNETAKSSGGAVTPSEARTTGAASGGGAYRALGSVEAAGAENLLFREGKIDCSIGTSICPVTTIGLELQPRR
ncbi:unnamed protein product [Ectocarpus sp. CCAP 1310/34]|nr:unnamed protein product [Ectocarpus sp. CCAP 1310/34]